MGMRCGCVGCVFGVVVWGVRCVVVWGVRCTVVWGVRYGCVVCEG